MSFVAKMYAIDFRKPAEVVEEEVSDVEVKVVRKKPVGRPKATEGATVK
jgi:hypothetical protein